MLGVREISLLCVWLQDGWVGVAPTVVLGTAPTLLLMFGLYFWVRDGFAPTSVWMKELKI